MDEGFERERRESGEGEKREWVGEGGGEGRGGGRTGGRGGEGVEKGKIEGVDGLGGLKLWSSDSGIDARQDNGETDIRGKLCVVRELAWFRGSRTFRCDSG